MRACVRARARARARVCVCVCVCEREREREIRIRMIYSFRPLPLMKGCGWMTYHLTVHTIIVPMSKKTNKLTTMYLTPY